MNQPFRASSALNVLLVLALLTPGALGQGTAADDEWAILVEDQAHDTASDAAPGPAPAPRADIIELAVQEDPTSIIFRFRTSAADSEAMAPSSLSAQTSAIADTMRSTGSVRTVIGFTVVEQQSGNVTSWLLVAQDETFQLQPTAGGKTLPIHAPDEATEWNFEVAIPRWALGTGQPATAGDRIEQLYVETTQSDGSSTMTDRAPNTGFAAPYIIRMATDGSTRPVWTDSTSDDFAAGPDVAFDTEGRLHLSYLVYNGERGPSVGAYHGVLDDQGIWQTERIGDAVFPTDIHIDDITQTRIAITSAATFVLYQPAPEGAGNRLTFKALVDGAWTTEAPHELTSGERLSVNDSRRAVPALTATEGRTIAAFQEGDLNTIAVVERSTSGWSLLTRFSEARFPNIAIDKAGNLHAAFFRETSDQSPNRANYGNLIYADEASGWSETTIAEEIIDQSKFWDTAEADGSFAFALTPDDVPAFVWEAERSERRFATLTPTGLAAEETPLVPTHGNPQLRMRMAFDSAGNAHIMSGYGGSDMYAIRAPSGGWYVENLDRGDMFNLAVAPDGSAATSYTQPHGGTTVAVSAHGPANAPFGPQAEATGPGDEFQFAPGPGTTLVLMALGFLGLALVTRSGARLGVDRKPTWFAPAFAFVGAFSRIQKDQLLAHATRDQIVAAVEATPNASAADLRRVLDVPRSTFFYHVERLERDGLLRVQRTGGQAFLAPGAGAASAAAPASALDQRLLEAAREEPGKSAAAYAQRLHANRRTILHHLQDLERRQLVTRFQVNARDVRWGILPDATLEEGG